MCFILYRLRGGVEVECDCECECEFEFQGEKVNSRERSRVSSSGYHIIVFEAFPHALVVKGLVNQFKPKRAGIRQRLIIPKTNSMRVSMLYTDCVWVFLSRYEGEGEMKGDLPF